MKNWLTLLVLPACLLPGCQDRTIEEAANEPVAAVNLRPNNVFPAAEFAGKFRVERGCIVLDVNGKPLTVVFPGPAAFARRGSVTGVDYQNTFIPFGQEIRAMGGETPSDPGLFKVSEEVKRRCPKAYFLLGPLATSGPYGRITLDGG